MANINDILGIAESYRNTVEHSAKHREILSIYNNHKPLARGYRVTENDAWCMTFISALFIKANAVDAIGITECGCQEYVNYAKKHGMTVDTPARGDLVFYDWGLDGHVDHVGIIYLVSGNNLYVYEGNKNDSVSTRIIAMNASTVKCFVRPRYDARDTRYDTNRLSYAASFSKDVAGKYKCVASDFVALRFNPFVSDDNKIAEIASGDTCINYGYYTNDWLLVEYKGKTGFANKYHLRKVGK